MHPIIDVEDLPAAGRIFIYGTGAGSMALYGYLVGRGISRFAGFLQTTPGPANLTIPTIPVSDYPAQRRSDDLILIGSMYFLEISQTLDGLGIDNYRLAGPMIAAHLEGQIGRQYGFIRRLGGGRLAFDIGANIGVLTTLLSRHYGTVIAFEPNPRLADMFALSTRGLKGVKREPLAINRNSGTARLHLPMPGKDAFSHFQVLSSIATGDQGGGSIDVEQVSLDDYCSQHDLRPDFIKIDAEWLDYEIIRGGWHLISTHRPLMMFEAYRLDDEVLVDLQKHYRLVAIPEHSQVAMGAPDDYVPLEVYVAATGRPPLNVGAIPL